MDRRVDPKSLTSWTAWAGSFLGGSWRGPSQHQNTSYTPARIDAAPARARRLCKQRSIWVSTSSQAQRRTPGTQAASASLLQSTGWKRALVIIWYGAVCVREREGERGVCRYGLRHWKELEPTHAVLAQFPFRQASGVTLPSTNHPVSRWRLALKVASCPSPALPGPRGPEAPSRRLCIRAVYCGDRSERARLFATRRSNSDGHLGTTPVAPRVLARTTCNSRQNSARNAYVELGLSCSSGTTNTPGPDDGCSHYSAVASEHTSTRSSLAALHMMSFALHGGAGGWSLVAGRGCTLCWS